MNIEKTSLTNKANIAQADKNNSLKNLSPTKTAQNSKKIESKIPNFIALESTIGAISMLAIRSDYHKHIFITDYEWLIIPPVTLKQFFLFRDKNNQPIAFVSWAKIDQETEDKLSKGITKLAPKDWNSGDKTYIIDIISPFMKQKDILLQLKNKQFKNKEIYFLQKSPDGKKAKSVNLNSIIADKEPQAKAS